MEIKPQAMALPKETTHLAKGKYGPIFPKTPACYGFTVVAKIIPGREPICPSFLEYAEYPFFSADEIKKALKIKSAVSEMLDQLQ